MAQSFALGRARANVGSRTSSWVLLGAFGVATFFRVWRLGAVGFNTDEAVYAGQAASMIGHNDFAQFFPVFRAHPLLFHLNLAGVFAITGVSDVAARLLAAAYGVATVGFTYGAGRQLYDNRVGLIAALTIAVMPYHVLVTRQALLDGPMTLFATATLFALARFATTERPIWLLGTGVLLGLATLTKEPAIVLTGAVYGFIGSQEWLRIRLRDLLVSMAAAAILVAAFPVAILVAGREETGRSYLTWQLLRRANHVWEFYFTELPPWVGIPTLLVILLGLPLLVRHRGWQETLLAFWIGIPVAFFTLWPVKGFSYLLPAAPAIAILFARSAELLIQATASRLSIARQRTDFVRVGLVGIVISWMGATSWGAVQPSTDTSLLAGAGGVPGGRETALWVDQNVPRGSTILTIGPSMANVIQFYGHRRALGLSVSPNPLHRNPSYTPVDNPDFKIRQSDIQYIVWDTYSASRSDFFSERLLSYVQRYNGREVYRYDIIASADNSNRGETRSPVTIVYEVRP